MKILVPVKQIAVVDEDFELRDDGKDVDPDYLNFEANEWDDYSYEAALNIMEASDGVEVVPVTVGPDDAEDVLRRCLAKGGDRGIRVWDDALEDANPAVVAQVLAGVAAREKPDMILTGTLSSDRSYAQTGVALAAALGWPHVAVVTGIEWTPGDPKATLLRELEGGLVEKLSVECPAVLTIQLGINTPRYASLRGLKQAKEKPVEELSLDHLGLSGDSLAELASFRVRRMYKPETGQAELIEGTPAEQAARLAEIIKELKGAA
ncbi:electron transfer flavoprotein subunit beta/FixA family protein [Methyloceanibacter sp. wino2]|uniref:electron transfer flavoprotein subunit beta/FixA family protein n=1 Tax=Methyloceanibacter sp. wino2 TaxID=2170729 RepID=UPI000D3E219C|nr:electron transfer flavoprotein subunit beta/FixA family protein [Methyloceanibacter sp. wino2]